MSHWKLTLSYDGTAFHGWQVQPDLPTVQGALADAIEQVTGEKLLPQGSGRTDAGVHALGQVASFSLNAAIPVANLHKALNRVLPPSIRVISTVPAPNEFHARHSARRKTYEYRIFERKLKSTAGAVTERICSPFLAPYVWDCRWPMNLVDMQGAADHLLGTHDFTSFAATDPDLAERDDDSDGPNPVKTIYISTLLRENNLLIYRVTGSGFLHHMVRNLVGTLVEIGRGSMTPDAVAGILAAKDRSAAGPTAPPQGLFLASVDYAEDLDPDEDLEYRSAADPEAAH